MSLTPAGERVLDKARRFLGEIDDLAQMLTLAQDTPQGLLRVNPTLGFGRSDIVPPVRPIVDQRSSVKLAVAFGPAMKRRDTGSR